MKHLRIILRPVISYIIIMCAGLYGASGQNFIIKGKITDQDTKKPLPFVNIGVKNQMKGTTSDINGTYQLELNAGEHQLIFSCVGFEKVTEKVTATTAGKITLDVSMKTTSQELNMIVVSASKYEQKIEDATNSIEILKPNLIENKNITSLDKALEQVPGVAIVDNEPQIRGGSGFSSGLGSRVLILIDEIPMLRGDAGRPVWAFLPIEDIEQIEVLKGASSVVFGSSALNGAINIRTAYPKEKPETKVTVHSGIYNNPSREYAKVWDGFNPVIMGASFIHSKRVNNFDYVIGGNVLSDPGYIAVSPMDTTGGARGTYDKHARINFGTRVRSNKVENLTYGINGNFMYSENAQSFFWMDSDTNIYRSYPGALTNFREIMYYVDPYVKYFGKKGASHTLKNRWFYNISDATNDQSSSSGTVYNEYQFSKKFKHLANLIINAGVMNMYTTSHGKVFSGEFGKNATKTADNFAVYAQLEKKFWERLTLAAGARYEYYKIADFVESKPVFRAGINMKATKITYIRASFGQGYRFPSIGERYITTFAGSFGFYPNPELKSETSWNSEVGIKQLFKISKLVGFLDICGFWQEYKNFIEFNAGLWGTSSDFSKNLGFKFLNTANARVRGLDCTLTGEGNLAKNLTLGFLAGYTFSDPVCLEPEKVYYINEKGQKFTYLSTSSDTTNYTLKYRIQHLGKLDVQLTWKSLAMGVSGRYYSYMANIDKFFYNFDYQGFFNTGIKKYRAENNNGMLIFDYRISYDFRKHFRFAFVVNNLFNKEYSLRPISVEPPRTTMIQVIFRT